MPWGGEGTKGRPDPKKCLYCGASSAEHDGSHPLCMYDRSHIYEKNQLPDREVPAEMRALVLEYVDIVTELGSAVRRAFR